jgi:hypothetical protein
MRQSGKPLYPPQLNDVVQQHLQAGATTADLMMSSMQDQITGAIVR